MEIKEHKKRHQELHQKLDELLADFINHTNKLPSKTTIMEIIEWSYAQMDNPTPDKED